MSSLRQGSMRIYDTRHILGSSGGVWARSLCWGIQYAPWGTHWHCGSSSRVGSEVGSLPVGCHVLSPGVTLVCSRADADPCVHRGGEVTRWLFR